MNGRLQQLVDPLKRLIDSERVRTVGKIVGAVLTIGLAASALCVSISTKNQQKADAAQLRDLQENALHLQQQVVDSSKSQLRFDDVGVRLEFRGFPGADDDGVSRKEYPRDLEGSADTVPENEWLAAAGLRWVFARIKNIGGQGISIEGFSLRNGEAVTIPLHNSPVCYPGIDPNSLAAATCPDYLTAGQGMFVYIQLADIELVQITEMQRQKGVELCANIGDRSTCGVQRRLKFPKLALTGGQQPSGMPR